MALADILLIVLLLIIFGGLSPHAYHSWGAGYGYGFGGLGGLLILLIILRAFGII